MPLEQKLCDFLAVDPIVLHLPAMNRASVQRVSEHEGDTELLAQVSNLVPDKDALNCDREIFTVRFNYTGKCVGIGP